MISSRNVEQAIGLAMLALIAIGAFFVLRPFLSAIIWAAVLAYSTWPIFVRVKESLGERDALASLIMVLAAACILVVPIMVLAWTMADQVVRLTGIVRGWVEHGVPSLPGWVADIPLVGKLLIKRWHDLFQTGGLANTLSPYIGTVRTQLLALAGTIGNALFQILLSLLIAFFLYRNGPEISAGVESIGVTLTGERGHRLTKVVGFTIRSVVESLLGTNLLQSIFGALGFWFAGIPGAFLLGFFLFFLTVIPFGAALVWVPAVIWVANSGQGGTAALLAGWCILVFPVLENFARLYFLKRESELPALLVLLGMLGGISTFGLLGVFLGPALLALVYTLIEEWRSPAIAI